jgi:tight adherence protein C
MILVSILVFLAVVAGLLALFLFSEQKRDSLENRFREVSAPSGGKDGGGVATLRRKLARLRDRLAGRLAAESELLEQLSSGRELTGRRLLLHRAGFRTPGAYRLLLFFRIGLPVLFLAAGVVLGKVRGLAPNHTFLLAVLLSVSGYVACDVYLKLRAMKREEDIRDALPDAIDLLVVCVESGLGLNAAFIKIAEEFNLASPALSEEFDVTNREMLAGKPRMDALKALADRTAIEDMRSLVAMLVQTEKLGTSLAQSLRVHSDMMRVRRRQKAEEAAAKTTIKLVFPLVFCLFPSLFIVLLGPGAIQILRVLIPISQQ